MMGQPFDLLKSPSVSLRPAQEKAEGEPKVKKGKTLLDDEDDEDGVDESLEEVRQYSCRVTVW